MRNVSDGGDIQYVEPWITQRFTKNEPRIVLNRRGECLWIAWINKGGLNAKAGQGVSK